MHSITNIFNILQLGVLKSCLPIYESIHIFCWRSRPEFIIVSVSRDRDPTIVNENMMMRFLARAGRRSHSSFVGERHLLYNIQHMSLIGISESRNSKCCIFHNFRANSGLKYGRFPRWALKKRWPGKIRGGLFISQGVNTHISFGEFPCSCSHEIWPAHFSQAFAQMLFASNVQAFILQWHFFVLLARFLAGFI